MLDVSDELKKHGREKQRKKTGKEEKMENRTNGKEQRIYMNIRCRTGGGGGDSVVVYVVFRGVGSVRCVCKLVEVVVQMLVAVVGG